MARTPFTSPKPPKGMRPKYRKAANVAQSVNQDAPLRQQFMQAFKATHGGQAPQQYNQQFRKRQAKREYLAAPIVPRSPITNRDLNQQTQAAVQMQYGPQDLALREQYQANTALQQNIPQWFQQYQDQLRQLEQGSQGAYDQAVQNMASLAFTQGSAAAQQSQQTIAQMQADAAQRGATLDPQAAQRAVQAQAVNNQNIGDQGRLLATLGFNQSSYLTNQGDIAARQQVQEMLNNAGRRRQLDQKGQQLAAEKGAFRTDFQAKARNTEQGNVLERALFGVKQQTADTQAKAARDRAKAAKADAKAKRRQTVLDFEAKHGVTPGQYARMTPDQRAASDRSFKKQSTPRSPTSDQPYKYGYTKKEWMRLPLSQRQRIEAQHANTGKGGTSGGGRAGTDGKGGKQLTASQVNDLNDVQNAVSWARRLQKQGKSLGQVRAVLTSGVSGKSSGGASLKIPSFDAWAVQAAINVVFGGSLSQADVNTLRQHGIAPQRTGYSYTTGPKSSNGPFTVKHKPGNRGGV